MEDIHHWEHLPTNERQLLGSKGMWLNVACGEIYFSKWEQPHLSFLLSNSKIWGKGSPSPLCIVIHGHPTNHRVCKASWEHISKQTVHAAPTAASRPIGRCGRGPCPASPDPPCAHSRAVSAHSAGTPEGWLERGRWETGQKLLGITRDKVNACLCAKHSAVHLRAYKISCGDMAGIWGTETTYASPGKCWPGPTWSLSS